MYTSYTFRYNTSNKITQVLQWDDEHCQVISPKDIKLRQCPFAQLVTNTPYEVIIHQEYYPAHSEHRYYCGDVHNTAAALARVWADLRSSYPASELPPAGLQYNCMASRIERYSSTGCDYLVIPDAALHTTQPAGISEVPPQACGALYYDHRSDTYSTAPALVLYPLLFTRIQGGYCTRNPVQAGCGNNYALYAGTLPGDRLAYETVPGRTRLSFVDSPPLHEYYETIGPNNLLWEGVPHAATVDGSALRLAMHHPGGFPNVDLEFFNIYRS